VDPRSRAGGELVTADVRPLDLGAAVALHAPGELQRLPDGRTSFLCRCDMRFAGTTIETARRAWGDHVAGAVIAAGGFSHYPHLEHAARDLHRIISEGTSALDPYGFGQRRKLQALDAHLQPVLEHIDREKGQ
jgi:hypothetical protein